LIAPETIAAVIPLVGLAIVFVAIHAVVLTVLGVVLAVLHPFAKPVVVGVPLEVAVIPTGRVVVARGSARWRGNTEPQDHQTCREISM
jgi:hypothetical protein